jgi:hypothetical protein
MAYVFLTGEGSGGRKTRETSDLPEPEIPKEPPISRRPGEWVPETPGPGRKGWPLFGQVRDPAGGTVAGATVRATIFPGHRILEVGTDAEGLYELELPERWCTFDVFANGYLPLAGVVNGFSNGTLDFHGEGKGPWRRDFVLQPAASLSGRVLGEGLAPVAGARVYVISPEHVVLDQTHIGNMVVTDSGGHFRFPGLLSGEVDVGARAPGYLPMVKQDVALPERGEATLEFLLERGRKVLVEVEGDSRGTVVRASDSRLRSKLLPPGGVGALTDALVGRQFADFPVVSAEEGEDGRYHLAGVVPLPADVEAIDKFSFVEPGLGILFDTTEPFLRLRLLDFTTVRTHVHDSTTGAPLKPKVFRVSGDSTQKLPVAQVEDGWLLPDDERQHSLHFELEGYQSARLDLPVDNRQWQEVYEVAMLPAAEGETGTFYLVFEPRLKGRLAVVCRNAEGRMIPRHIDASDSKGRWEVKVPPGEYAVSILGTGMIPVTLPRVVVTRALTETHRVALSPGGGLELKVTDSGGELLEKVWLELRDPAGTQIDVHVITHVSEGRAFLSINYLPSAATARADSGLAPGPYVVTVYKPGYEAATREFVVQGTEVASVTIALSPR